MKKYLFAVRYEEFSAEIVMGGEWSLYDFAEFIIESIGFSFDHSFEFCNSLEGPYESTERYTLFSDTGIDPDYDDPGVRKTMLSMVFQAGTSMLFYFDYGDDWHFPVTCTEIGDDPAAKRRYRKLLSTRGNRPEQYPQWDDDDEE